MTPTRETPVAKRARHDNNEIEAVLSEAEAHGWVFTLDRLKFKGKCACGKHTHTVGQGKRVPNRSAKNLRTQLTACWR